MKREFKVGLLVLAALTVFALAIFVLGGRSNLFVRENRYSIRFEVVGGLAVESPVQLDGVIVGRVREVVLPVKVEEKLLTVWVSIDGRYSERVRKDSLARIKTLGLLGDKYVEVSSGSQATAVIPAGGEIPAAAPTDVDQLIASGEDVVDNVVAISASLRTILVRMEAGEGVIGELLRETEDSAHARESLLGAIDSMHSIARKIDSGQGTLGALISDRQLADRVESLVGRLETVASSLEEGEGTMAALLHDAELKERVEDSIDKMSTTAAELSELATELRDGNGLLQRLIRDEEYAEEVTTDLKKLLGNLETISTRLERGDGTVGRLLEDPALYEAMNDVAVGIDESRFLRWLVRNRQKKGIAKRYEETLKELEAAGIEPEPATEQRQTGGGG